MSASHDHNPPVPRVLTPSDALYPHTAPDHIDIVKYVNTQLHSLS